MDDKKNDDKPKYTEVPKNTISSTLRDSHFSHNDKDQRTLYGVVRPKEQGEDKD